MATTYDAVEYPTLPRSLGHPGHMNAVARMFGVPAPPVENCRVLEIGGGDGVHLVSCAVTMPDATFVGIDLSTAATARGNNLIERLGLRNVQLIVADILTWEPPAEPFDYVLVHGVYSWIPEPVRDALMALVGRALAPRGVACVSYNCYPAGYARRMLWEMMKYHVGDRTDPDAMIDRAIELAEFIRLSRAHVAVGDGDPFDNDVALVLDKQPRSVLFHDDLAPVNRPVYFHEFADHARRHGLRFVAELEPHVMANGEFPPAIGDLLRTLAKVNPERREQYYDFACLRRFRQTLLTREPHEPRGFPDPKAVDDLFISGNCGTDAIDFGIDRPMTFAVGATAVEIGDPLMKAAMVVLVENRPRRSKFPELLAAALRKLDRTDASETELATLRTGIVEAWTAGLVLLKGFDPKLANGVSERPVASPFARAQLELDDSATTVHHLILRFEDEPGRRLVRLLDGSRTLDDLVRELLPLVPPEKRTTEADFRAGIRRNLESFAGAGLLVG